MIGDYIIIGDYSREAIILNIFVKGGDYSREAVNRGTAIIRGNPLSFLSSSLGPNSDSFFQVIFKWYLPIFLRPQCFDLA